MVAWTFMKLCFPAIISILYLHRVQSLTKHLLLQQAVDYSADTFQSNKIDNVSTATCVIKCLIETSCVGFSASHHSCQLVIPNHSQHTDGDSEEESPTATHVKAKQNLALGEHRLAYLHWLTWNNMITCVLLVGITNTTFWINRWQ